MTKLAYHIIDNIDIENLRELIRLLKEYGIIRSVAEKLPDTHEELLKYLVEVQKPTVIESILADPEVKSYIDTYAPYWAGNGDIVEAKQSLEKIFEFSLMAALTKRVCDALYFSGGNTEAAAQRIQQDIDEVVKLFKMFNGIM